MEENFYHSAFEELIKEKADQYKMYPSDKVWKNIDRSLHWRRKWYWSGFVVLLSGISYLAVTELVSPPAVNPAPNIEHVSASDTRPSLTAAQLIPFPSAVNINADSNGISDPDNTLVSAITVEDSGNITASFEIPMKFLDLKNISTNPNEKASLRISGLEPLGRHEVYNIELSWPVADNLWRTPAELYRPSVEGKNIAASPRKLVAPVSENRINWLQEHAAYKFLASTTKRISWQLAFSPTVNYRKLTGRGVKSNSSSMDMMPVALDVDGDPDKLVNHKPALGFELGTHGMLSLSKRLTLKGGLQFNYSKYDIAAFRAPVELATISLNSSTGQTIGALTSYTDLRNFGGSSVEILKNQYFQLSAPIGLELRVLGNEKLQFNIAGTIQPTYLLNKNTYLITNDYKNYTKEPSLVRKWNVNAGAEAFISYSSGDVKWQIGPQFRYQLLSSYKNEYPIKEYLMEYGIKIGITKTIR